jgi:glycosyltransferase involved in cell wall biosynthesis
MSIQRKPHIALVGQMPPTKGGQTTFMLNLMASGLSAEFEFLPYTVTRPPKKNVIENWGYSAVLRGGLPRVAYGILLTIWRLLLFPVFIAVKKIELVQIQASDYQVFWESVAYAIIARLMSRPILFRIGGAFDLFHGNSPVIIKRLIEASLRLPHYLIVQSEFARDYVGRAVKNVDMVILSNWTRDPLVAEIVRPPRENPIFIFSASNEALRKGIHEVLEAARILDGAGSPARFHLVTMAPQLMERTVKLGLGNIVKIEGAVEHERMLEIMRENDVFLLPSHGEGFPNSLIEAMSVGMASIVTPIGAVPEIVADGGALIIEVGDAAGLAAAIERLTSDQRLLKKLGDQALDIVRRKYTAELVLPVLADAYHRLLA